MGTLATIMNKEMINGTVIKGRKVPDAQIPHSTENILQCYRNFRYSQGLESVSIRTFLLPRASDFKGMLSDKVSLM